MEITRLREWFVMMERLREADIPYVEVDGIMYTPRQILAHAEANDATWQRIQVAAPNLDPEYPVDLLITHMKERYAQGTLATIYRLGIPAMLTPEQQIAEVEAGTQIGMELLEAERILLQELAP